MKLVNQVEAALADLLHGHALLPVERFDLAVGAVEAGLECLSVVCIYSKPQGGLELLEAKLWDVEEVFEVVDSSKIYTSCTRTVGGDRP